MYMYNTLTVLFFLCIFSTSVLSMNPQKMCKDQIQPGNIPYGPEPNPLLQFLYRDDIPQNDDDVKEKENIPNIISIFSNVDLNKENE